ncbi:MAG TPA: ATP-binding protein [Nocardioidaceae bacterium]|nr:ATP-binding protein [Nocardioidaceae bacterium]
MTGVGNLAAEPDGLGAPDVDAIALSALRAALSLPGVVRAGLGLTVVGGRQLRFLPSDQDRLDLADWCLIDAFDRLPLNDAVRTGAAVVVESMDAMSRRYPELTAVQSGGRVRSLLVLPLGPDGARLGGLLLYLDHETVSVGDDQLRLAATVSDALLALRPVDSGRHVGTYPLPVDATAPGLARRLLRQALADSSVNDDVLDAALLCLSELVTNVVMHAGRPPSMDVDLTEGTLTVTIHHDSAGPDTSALVAEPDPLRISGRGLELVDAVASAWGSESRSTGTTTWFQLDL